VCGIWTDGRNPKGVAAIYRIKGEDRGERPLGTILIADQFAVMIDGERIKQSVKSLMMVPDLLASRLGSMAFIRVPIPDHVGTSLPDRLVSRDGGGGYWLQNWMPEGCRALEGWVESIAARGIDTPAATSMNVSIEPEITTPAEGEAFCHEHDIPMLLVDKESPQRAQGSFPILLVDDDGIHVIREGHFPAELFTLLLARWEVDLSSCEPGNYPLVSAPGWVIGDDEVPERMRARLLRILDGPPEENRNTDLNGE
jgi:hypothetical protein